MPPADVVAGATLTTFKPHSETWNLKDAGGAVIPDSDYRIVVEIATDNFTNKNREVPFTKGAMPMMTTPADGAALTAMKLALE